MRSLLPRDVVAWRGEVDMTEPYTVVPMTPMRKVIAARMTEAKQTIPHYRLTVDIEMDALLAARERENAASSGIRISVNECLIKACAMALMEHPAINVQCVDQEIRCFPEADISVIVAIEGGLVAPVIRRANRKTLRDIATEVKALTARAAAGQLRMDEILGGTFTISNLGAYGVDQFDAIINSPQCAILAVGRAKPQMTVAKSGEARIATILRATLSVDHRAIDGAVGAAFLKTLREKLEQPKGLFAAQAD